jgi:hypothetical protein
MNKIGLLVSVLCLSTIGAFSQVKIEELKADAPGLVPAPVPVTPSIVIGGFVRADLIWDSRKSASVREDHLNLYPLDVLNDANGKDLNAVPQSNFHSVVSRINIKITGPNAFGAKTSGFMEGDFFGNFEGSIGLFRLRHANLTLDWAKTKLMVGQSWYPQFVTECFPGVANFSTGILFNPFGWVSQAKVTKTLSKNTTFAVTMYKDREFSSVAPTGVVNEPSFNSVLPTLHGNLQFKTSKVLLGIGLEYRSLRPRTSIIGGTPAITVENTGKATSTTMNAYAKFTGKKATLKTYAIIGQNLTHLVMLGGYLSQATTSVQETFIPTKTNAFWAELLSNNPKVAPALFLGYTVNGGASEEGKASFGRGITLDKRSVKDVFRAAGRIDFKSGKMRFSPELEYTTANWGLANKAGKVTGDLSKVGNLRFLFSTVLTF